MKKANLLAVVLFGLLGISVRAQEITTTTMNAENKKTATVFCGQGGVNFSNLYTDDSEAKTPICEPLSVQPQVLYARNDLELEYNYAFFENKVKFQRNYIEVPVMFVGNRTKNRAGVATGFGFDFGALGIGARYNYGLTKVWKDSRLFNNTKVVFPNAKIA